MWWKEVIVQVAGAIIEGLIRQGKRRSDRKKKRDACKIRRSWKGQEDHPPDIG